MSIDPSVPGRMRLTGGRALVRRAPVRLALVVALAASAVALALVPAAYGSCVGPMIGIGAPPDQPVTETATPVEVDRSQELTVGGTWFRVGCEDAYVGGCAGSPGRPVETESPMSGIVLELTQGTRTWRLATADAAGDQEIVTWRIRIPDDAAAGPATLSAAGAQLPIMITA